VPGPSRVSLAATLGRVLTGDQAHIHHRLLRLGFSHRAAVLTLYALMVLCSAVALLTMDRL
jgi:UDP-GlcNAc:undecaprenyl-phosphate GlcNAc-1-phosphate transferase